MFSQKILWRRELITSAFITSIVKALIYMHLLTMTCLHNKAAVVSKYLLTATAGVGNSRCIDNFADYTIDSSYILHAIVIYYL